jgi:hypothetical protein
VCVRYILFSCSLPHHCNLLTSKETSNVSWVPELKERIKARTTTPATMQEQALEPAPATDAPKPAAEPTPASPAPKQAPEPTKSPAAAAMDVDNGLPDADQAPAQHQALAQPAPKQASRSASAPSVRAHASSAPSAPKQAPGSGRAPSAPTRASEATPSAKAHASPASSLPKQASGTTADNGSGGADDDGGAFIEVGRGGGKAGKKPNGKQANAPQADCAPPLAKFHTKLKLTTELISPDDGRTPRHKLSFCFFTGTLSGLTCTPVMNRQDAIASIRSAMELTEGHFLHRVLKVLLLSLLPAEDLHAHGIREGRAGEDLCAMLDKLRHNAAQVLPSDDEAKSYHGQMSLSRILAGANVAHALALDKNHLRVEGARRRQRRDPPRGALLPPRLLQQRPRCRT